MIVVWVLAVMSAAVGVAALVSCVLDQRRQG
jgi:hypothetical protein